MLVQDMRNAAMPDFEDEEVAFGLVLLLDGLDEASSRCHNTQGHAGEVEGLEQGPGVLKEKDGLVGGRMQVLEKWQEPPRGFQWICSIIFDVFLVSFC